MANGQISPSSAELAHEESLMTKSTTTGRWSQ